MRVHRLLVALGGCGLAISVNAHDVVTCKSPDGKFALHHVHADNQPYAGETSIVDLATHQTVVPLASNRETDYLTLLWSPDSKRVAYYDSKMESQQTRVFFRTGASFNEIKLPELPSPKLPPNATGGDSQTKARLEPMQWTASGDLILESELQNEAWGRTALKITVAFDAENRASVRGVEQEKTSIVDYFLLMPENEFEGPPSVWLQHARTGGGAFYLCENGAREKFVDETNGYIRCPGDGAQSNFEAALFRHRDGRPLLALAESGMLEEQGPDSVYLKFFELGNDGKMHEAKRSIFPIPDSNEDRWQFVLPREGRTILVRAPKSKKILHKFIWDGETFQKEK